MAHGVESFFRSGINQLRCTPRLIIPFLISNALAYALIWTIILSFVFFSLPVLGKIVPVIEKNQDLISQIVTKQSIGINTDLQVQELQKEFSDLFPDILPILIAFLIGFLLIMLIGFLLFAWTRGGTIGYTWQGITGSLDFKNFRYHARNNIFRIAGLWILIILISIILFLMPFSALVILPMPAGIIVFILLLLLFLILWVIMMLLLFFSEECIVVENKSIIEAVRQSKGLVLGDIASVLLFIVIFISIILIFGVVSFTFEFITGIFNSNISSFFELFSLIVLGPWIILAKLNFFLDRTGRPVMAMEKEIAYIEATKGLIIRSPVILVDFVKKNLLYVLTAFCFYLGGFGLGYYVGNSFSFLKDELMLLIGRSLENTLLGPYHSLPFLDLLNYFSNNGIVALNQALSGIFFVIPSLFGVIVNGIIMGLFYGVMPVEAASAFIALHGVFEITAFLITTAAGIRLGVKFIKGTENENELLDETLMIVLASLLLIGIAAFLEAFITPVIVWIMI